MFVGFHNQSPLLTMIQRCKKWNTLFKMLLTWGPFLESPGNFMGPKTNIQIEM